MKRISCKDGGMYGFKLEKLGRVKRIFWDKQDRAYYNRGSMRTYLDDVERLPYPYFYEDEHGKLGYISGFEYIGAFSPIYVEIVEDGDAVQLWTEI